MAKINTNDLAATLMEKHGMGRLEALRFLEAFVEVIREGIARDRQVKMKSLGTFKVVDVDARESVNVNTGERLLIGSHAKLTFTPETTLKELINKPFSAFETVILNEGVTFEEAPLTDPEEGAPLAEPEEGAPLMPPKGGASIVEAEEGAVEEPVVEEPVVEEPVEVKEEETEEPTPDKIEEETREEKKEEKREEKKEESIAEDEKEPAAEVAVMSKMMEKDESDGNDGNDGNDGSDGSDGY